MVFISQFLTLNSQTKLQIILPGVFSIFSYCLLPQLPCSPNSLWLILSISKETVSNVKTCIQIVIIFRNTNIHANIVTVYFTYWKISVEFSSVARLCPTLCDPMNNCSMPGFPVHTNSQSWLKLKSIESVMPSSHLILYHSLLLLPSIFPSIRVFSNESALRIRWPKYWSFSVNVTLSNEYSGLISFRMDGLDLLAVQGTLKSLLQHHSRKIWPDVNVYFWLIPGWKVWTAHCVCSVLGYTFQLTKRTC